MGWEWIDGKRYYKQTVAKKKKRIEVVIFRQNRHWTKNGKWDKESHYIMLYNEKEVNTARI